LLGSGPAVVLPARRRAVCLETGRCVPPFCERR